MNRVSRFKGQSVVEYAVLVGVVAGAIIGMQTYIKRGVQAGLKQQTDHWLVLSTDPAQLPQECLTRNPPLNDPAQCTQWFGAESDDTRPNAQLSTTRTNGQQQKRVTYRQLAATPVAIETIQRTMDGTQIERVGNGKTVSIGLPPPQFVRAPTFPTGYPTGYGFKLPAPALPQSPSGDPHVGAPGMNGDQPTGPPVATKPDVALKQGSMSP